jgi:hypothetical protein
MRIFQPIISGSVTITDSLTVLNGITGSLYGTVSEAITASYISPTFISASAAASGFGGATVSASYAATASYYQESDPIFVAVSASFATTASLNSFTSSYISASSSFSTRITNNEASITSLNAVTNSFATLTSNTFSGTQTINGNVIIHGTASIDYLNVIYESASVIYSSGSNQFGDSASDTQTLIGKVVISGSLETTGSITTTTGIGVNVNSPISGAVHVLSTTGTDAVMYFDGGDEANARLTAAANTIDKLPGVYLFDRNVGDFVNNSISGSGYIALERATSPQFANRNDVIYVNNHPEKGHYFATNNGSLTSVRLVIDGAGNVGIGKYLPNAPLDVSGNVNITGSLGVSLGITGSLFGTASYADSSTIAQTASYYNGSVISASYAETASYYGGSVVSASYSSTASYIDPLYISASAASYGFGGATVSASYADTSSYIDPLFISASVSGYGFNIFAYSASYIDPLFISASAASYGFSGITVSASYAETASYVANSISASYAATASYVVNSISASYSENSNSASYSENSNLLNGAGKNTFITTGSDGFAQTIYGSLTINQNLTVLGSSSIQYITSSQLNIADNIISVNTIDPGVRFGGISVIDSGSAPQVSGSLLFDSQNNQWIFVHQSAVWAAVTSSAVIVGPQTFNNIGNETALTRNRIPKAAGAGLGEHITDSNITDTGTVVSINSNTYVTGSLTVTQGVTGSLFGTASRAEQAMTASYINPLSQDVTVTGSITVTGLINGQVVIPAATLFNYYNFI